MQDLGCVLSYQWSRALHYARCFVQIDRCRDILVCANYWMIKLGKKTNLNEMRVLTQVTSITNQMVDAAGVDFITAYRAFLDFVGEAHIYAFGRDDLVFAENLKLYGWTTLPIPPYVNGNPWFKTQGIDLKGKHACDVGELAGVAFAGRKHTALADARGVASGFVALIKKGAPNLFLGD